ncbi:hypothetical protein [Enterococcus gallinarum]|uniref:hypothetical protein n=1 Tax=Enterococcus gallinarum TaxID=1353 RepID=UPI0012E1F83E|nr:hypothetical protein [Enterococcus gallinarum]MCR1926396.1 hypothetical protein [Enterococcus gallinarum]MUN90852.1 hypothetical protein [Enterococcus gallinarum]
MIRLHPFKNIFKIVDFFITETFKGVLNQGFFKTKSNRILLSIGFLLLYVFYFYMNVKQAAILSSGTNSVDSETTTYLISSFSNTILILSILVFLIVNSTFSLSPTTLFTIKKLPFSNKEITIAQKVFKVLLGLIIFEVLLVVMLPSLTMITLSLTNLFLFFVTTHIVFLVGFLVCQLVFSLSFFIIRSFKIRIYTFNIFFSIFSVFYMFYLRFKIDTFIVSSEIIINTQSLFFFLLTQICLMGLNILLLLSIASDNETFIRESYTLVPNFIKTKNFVILAFFRSKKFILIFILVISISVANIVVVKSMSAITYNIYIYLLVPFNGILYSSANYTFRHTLIRYNISIVREFFLIQITNIVLSIPILLSSLVNYENFVMFLFSLTLFNISLSMGLIFPKQTSSVNETFSTLTSIILSVLVIAIINNTAFVLLALTISSLILLVILRQENYVR